jgi:hypothetical protein
MGSTTFRTVKIQTKEEKEGKNTFFGGDLQEKVTVQVSGYEELLVPSLKTLDVGSREVRTDPDQMCNIFHSAQTI